MHFTKIVTDDPSQRTKLPRLGKIRLGVMVQSRSGGKEYPRELSHFVVPPEVTEVYGENPTKLDVLFPSLPIEKFFVQRFAAYNTSQKLLCEGNGQVARRKNRETNQWEDRDSCLCEWLENGHCSKQAMLFMILPRVNYGGLYQLDTGSSASMSNLNSTIQYLISLVGLANLSRVPVVLKRQETLIEDKQGRAQKHWPVYADVQLKPNAFKALLDTPNPTVAMPLLPEFIEEGPLEDTPIVIEEEEATKTAGGKLDDMATRLRQKQNGETQGTPAPRTVAPKPETTEQPALETEQEPQARTSKRELF